MTQFHIIRALWWPEPILQGQNLALAPSTFLREISPFSRLGGHTALSQALFSRCNRGCWVRLASEINTEWKWLIVSNLACDKYCNIWLCHYETVLFSYFKFLLALPQNQGRVLAKKLCVRLNPYSNPHMYNTEWAPMWPADLGWLQLMPFKWGVVIAWDVAGRRHAGDFCTVLSILLLSYLKPQTNKQQQQQKWGSCPPLTTALRKQTQVAFWEFEASQPGLPSECQASQGFLVKLCLKTTKANKTAKGLTVPGTHRFNALNWRFSSGLLFWWGVSLPHRC